MIILPADRVKTLLAGCYPTDRKETPDPVRDYHRRFTRESMRRRRAQFKALGLSSTGKPFKQPPVII